MKTLFKLDSSLALKLFFTLSLTLMSSFTFAEEFKFQFNFRGEIWNHLVSANNKDFAFEIASQDCLNHFTKSKGKEKIRVDIDTADALLNTCANPK